MNEVLHTIMYLLGVWALVSFAGCAVAAWVMWRLNRP